MNNPLELFGKLCDTPAVCNITSGYLNLRDKRGADGNSLAQIQKGESFLVGKLENGWWIAKLNNGMVGYVSADYVKVTNSSNNNNQITKDMDGFNLTSEATKKILKWGGIAVGAGIVIYGAVKLCKKKPATASSLNGCRKKARKNKSLGKVGKLGKVVKLELK